MTYGQTNNKLKKKIMEKGKITFEQLPQAVSALIERVERLAGKMDEMIGRMDGKDTGKRNLLSLEDVSALLGKSASTIYAMTSEKRIPYRKRGNKLYFFEDEVMLWIEQGGTSGTGNEDEFKRRLEELRNGKKRKPGSMHDNSWPR